MGYLELSVGKAERVFIGFPFSVSVTQTGYAEIAPIWVPQKDRVPKIVSLKRDKYESPEEINMDGVTVASGLSQCRP